MPRKIVRDINQPANKEAFIIKIKEEDIVKAPKNKANVVDISRDESIAFKQIKSEKVSQKEQIKPVSPKSDAGRKIIPKKIAISGNSSKLKAKNFIPVKSPVVFRERGGIKDIQKSPSEKKPSPQFVFFAFTPKNLSDKQRASEAVRLFTIGALILLLINMVSIYQRGIVLKNKVANAAVQGYEQMLNAGQQTTGARFEEAEKTFQQAQNSFNTALEAISFLQTNQEAFFAHEKTVDSVQNLLQSATSLASAGKDFTVGLQNLRALPQLFLQFNQKTTTASDSLTKKLKKDLESINKAATEVESANTDLQKVSPDILPSSFHDKLAVAKQKIATLNTLLGTTQELLPAVLDLLGDRYPHRYLILLQNDAESRPTGGFIGSYLLVDINDGYLTNFEFHDIYETDGHLKEDIPAPEDIARVSKNWRMRDSNYSPDFSISAEKAAWFLQKEGGPSIDTVIAVNQSILGDLLAVTGPIQVEGIAQPLDANNYQLVLSYMIESKTNGAAPKEILKNFINAFQHKLLQEQSLAKMLPVFFKAYQDKKVLFYSRYQNIQKVFDRFHMSGRVEKTDSHEDYLQVVSTSIGGNKSDQYLEQHIQHNTLIRHNGSITDEVTITRHHTLSDQDVVEWKKTLKTFGFGSIPDEIQYILGKAPNKALIKVYVPNGSVLAETSMIDQSQILTRYDEELDKTYFMFEMSVDPGQEQSVTLIYNLPQQLQFEPVDTYKIFLQNQASLHDSQLTKQLFFEPGVQSYRQFPQDFMKNNNGEASFNGPLNQELYFSALVGP